MNIAQTTLQQLPIAAWAYDTQDEFRHVVWNQAMANLTGLATSDAHGKTNYDLFDKETADKLMADNRAVIAGGKTFVIDREVLRTRDGQEVPVRTTKVPLFDADGQPTLLIGICERLGAE